MRRLRPLALAALATTALACSSDGSTSSSDTVMVFAAASLTAAFTDIGDAFTADNPDVEVVLNLAGSFALASQIAQGAPADVFAAADPAAMDLIPASEVSVFATNRAAIIVQAGNPLGISAVEDLARPDVVVVGCAPTAACGRLLDEVTRTAGVTVTPRSLEDSVRGVVTKVTLGEADAGMVFATDVIAAGPRASGVELPDHLNVTVRYPISALATAPNSPGAQGFVDFVLSPDGQAILAAHGFEAP